MLTDSELITRKELAERLKVSERTIDIWRSEKGLPFTKISRFIRFDIEAVNEWIKKQN